MPFPTWLKRGHIHDDAAARIGRFAEADDQHVAWYAEIFDGPCQRETVWRDDAHVGLAVDKAFGIEFLGVDDGAVDIGENLELIGHAGVIAIRGQAIADAAIAALRFDKRFNHAGRMGLLADPDVGQYGHNHSLLWDCFCQFTV